MNNFHAEFLENHYMVESDYKNLTPQQRRDIFDDLPAYIVGKKKINIVKVSYKDKTIYVSGGKGKSDFTKKTPLVLMPPETSLIMNGVLRLLPDLDILFLPIKKQSNSSVKKFLFEAIKSAKHNSIIFYINETPRNIFRHLGV